MNDSTETTSRYGMLASGCALGSLAMCYAEVGLVAVLGAFGVYAADVAPHIQAVFMWALALLAIFGLLLDRKQHGRPLPLLLGIAGLVIMVLTLYAYYDWRILTLSYILLISAIFINQTMALRTLYHTVQEQARELEELNQSLEQRVDDQVGQIERLNRLKRFFSPQVAQLVTDSTDIDMLASHRRYITAMFVDLRGFTAFSERMEPEEAMEMLQDFHEQMGRLVFEHNGTLDHRAGDGLLVIFNDPVPCEEPELATVRLAVAMRERVQAISGEWVRRGYELGFGIGIGSGYATMGFVGTEGRIDYTANGNVVNLASRLCDEARNGQIIVNRRTYVEIEQYVNAEALPDMKLKGIDQAVPAYNIIGLEP